MKIIYYLFLFLRLVLDEQQQSVFQDYYAYERILRNGNFDPYMPNFTEFWEFLKALIDAEGCPGCRKGGGNPACKMRTCAREKGVEACPLCNEYPCENFNWLAS